MKEGNRGQCESHRARVKQYGGRLLSTYTGAVLMKLIDIDYQTELFEAVAYEVKPS